jgi:PAS domain S-box-containing protein
MLLVPLAFLFGVLRARLAHSSVGRLVVELGQAPASEGLRDALARALADPTLELAYWLPEEHAFVDEDGRQLRPPEPGGPRFATVVERGGRPVAALVHDVTLLEDPALLEAVTAAAGLALENERRLHELRRSEARNRALLDAIPDLLFRIGADGRYRDFKVEDEQILTAGPSEIVGRSLHDLLPADVADRILACGRRALAEGAAEPVEYELVLGGEPRLFEGRVVVSGEDEFLLMVRDFTERRRREEELHRVYVELEQQFAQLERERDFTRTVVESAPSLFLLVDDAGGIVRFNRACEEATGFADDGGARGRPFWEVFAEGAEADGLRACWEASAAGAPPEEREHRWRARDGSTLVVASSLTPLVDDVGRQRYLLVGLDVTQRKEHEAELRASRARLVEAGDRERRRLERNLHDGAQQRLVSLSIALRLAAAKLRSDPDEAERLLGSASEELGSALAELRELARGIHPAVLSERGLAPALEALAGRSPVPVDVSLDADRLPEPVEAAAYYVVSEALANVAKYADASSVSVRVGHEDGLAVVEVRDDGVGGADPAGGTGLRGLADRVEALNGRLEVESEAGRGTGIRAVIPC